MTHASRFLIGLVTCFATHDGIPSVGRAAWRREATAALSLWPGGPLDDLVIQQDRWAQRPGELVLSSDFGFGVPLSTQITVSGVPGTL